MQRDGALRYHLEGRKRGINESNHRMAAMGRSSGCRYQRKRDAQLAHKIPRADDGPKLCSALYNAFDGEPDTPLEVMERYKDKAIVFIPKRDTWTW